MSEESQYSEHPGGWIEWFCAHEDHQFLCEVDDDFISDPFNQHSIRERFKCFKEAIQMILQPSVPEDQDLEDERFLEVYQEASDIYGLLHARFIYTIKGSNIMREKYLQGKFGYCPRIYCERQHVIPIGLCDEIKTARVKVFCPRCEDIYLPKKKCSDLDGAYFGRSFPQFLLQTFQDLSPKLHLLPDTVIKVNFEPTLFGFKVAGKNGSKYKPEQKLQPNHIITIIQPELKQEEEPSQEIVKNGKKNKKQKK